MSPTALRTVSRAVAARVAASRSRNRVSEVAGRPTSTETFSGRISSPVRAVVGSTAETTTSTSSVPEGSGQA
ncbi:hypothetical protein SCALM49S_04021 [Streptomyces californicus]